MNQRSPLASLDLSDDRVPSNGFLEAKLLKTREEMIALYARLNHREEVIRGLLCFVRQLGGRPDATPELRNVLLTHPHVLDAQEILL